MKELINNNLQNAITQKSEHFNKFIDRIITLTSDNMWRGTVDVSEEGMYFTLENARSSFKVYVTSQGKVTRKPRNISFDKKFSISGYGKTLDRVR